MRVLRGVGIGIGVALRLEDPLIKMFREADTNWFYCTRCGAYANPMRPSIAAYSNEMFCFNFRATGAGARPVIVRMSPLAYL